MEKPVLQKIDSLRRRCAIAIVLAIITAAVYHQMPRQEFTNYDDNWYVTDNPHVISGLNAENIRWALTTTSLCYWQPATWISLQLDAELGNGKCWVFKLHNLLLHLANTILLFFLFERMMRSVWPSAFVAALFALHPLHVESVAWITERKDVLSSLFWLLTMLFYYRYAGTSSKLSYILSLLCLAIGLTSKPMLVTLPFVLLLMDYWPLGRQREGLPNSDGMETPQTAMYPHRKRSSLLIEKIPFFLIVMMSCIVTLYVNRTGGSFASKEVFGFWLRVQNALVCYGDYLVKMIWPVNLVVFYPLPKAPYSAVATVLAAGFLAGFSIFAVYLAIRKNRRWLLVGWLWYLGTLVPVIGLTQVGSQAMADRFTYIPLVGAFIIVAWSAREIIKALKLHWIVPAFLSAAILIVLSICSFIQIGYWQNSITLHSHTLDVMPDNYIGHVHLGAAYYDDGQFEKAIPHMEKGLPFVADEWEVNENIAMCYLQLQDFQQAYSYLQKALEKNPKAEKSLFCLGCIYLQTGQISDATAVFEDVLKYHPDNLPAQKALQMIKQSK